MPARWTRLYPLYPDAARPARRREPPRANLLSLQLEDHGSLPPERGLALEMQALRRLERAAAQGPDSRAPGHGRASDAADGGVEPAAPPERLLVWESARPAVMLPRLGEPAAWARRAACAARGVPLLRRESGGGAVVVGPGCLNVALALTLDRRPWLADVGCSYDWLLGRVARILAVDGIAVHATDLALHGRKFAGHAQRRVRGALLHHGVLLYDLDLDLVDALLPEPPRRPAWRGERTHREFLINAPLARAEIVRRLRRLPAALAC